MSQVALVERPPDEFLEVAEPVLPSDRDSKLVAAASPASAQGRDLVPVGQPRAGSRRRGALALVVPSDELERQAMQRIEESQADCTYIFEKIRKTLPEQTFACSIREEFPHDISVEYLQNPELRFAVVRKRNGGFVAGLAGNCPAMRNRAEAEGLPIFRSQDRDEIAGSAVKFARFATFEPEAPVAAQVPARPGRLVSTSALIGIALAAILIV